MAGQTDWKDPGSSTNSYVVNPEVAAEIYYKSTYNTVFGRLNGFREVKTTDIINNGGKITIDAGNDSPVWEKDHNDNAEARFTTREENKGMATYGDADVKPGDFAQYMHSVCYVRQVDSPAYPIVGFESSENIKQVVRDLVKVEKDNIGLWRSKEMDLDGFRSIFLGASRGLLSTSDGGRGITLFGGSAGQARSPYNTYVEGQTGLTTPSATLSTHESNLATALSTMSDNSAYAFDYESHLRASYHIDQLYFKPVKVGKVEYRAVCLIDEDNVYRMTTAGGTLSEMWKYARERAADNPALWKRGELVLDDILYVPTRQSKFFRPSVSGSSVLYGAGLTSDPRSKTFSNTSKITTAVYLGAGALLRGRRKGVNFTVDEGKHGKNQAYALHYHDGWTRHDWFTKDDRTEMMNDSMLVCFNYDPGVMKAYNS